ncbi:MAG: AmmeMemoRadiSam system protein A [Nanoarchaeota archaeon]|nr:AmmeMemoRadiSam system protein A [Nanoarchaeota archaeon]
MTTKKEQEFLLNCAKNAILNCQNITYPDLNKLSSTLKQKRGVFVTLELNGQLRGCIGTIQPVMPLYEAVIKNAASAGYSDPRFPPMTKEEANKVTIEISILTEPERLNYADENDLLKKLNPDLGIIIKKGFATATFLPQVWEQLPDKEQFLANLCMKANLNPEAWKEKDMEIFTYKVEKFVQ